MIVDNTLVFSDSQAVTANAASTNQIDIGAAGTPYGASAAVARDIGIGTFIELYITVTEAFNNLTNIVFSLQVDDAAGFGTAVTVATGPAVVLADLALGKRIRFPARLPEGTNKRYIRLYYDITGVAPTTGKIFAGVVASAQKN